MHLFFSGRWAVARKHDLRGLEEAARWVGDHPVEFEVSDVELQEQELETLQPIVQSEPVPVPGRFQRLFVDRESDRLFLTTDREGLVYLDISLRYAFELEGVMGMAGSTDFYIVDESTAYLEETVDDAGNRDLVVLDISDRQEPREVARLRGLIPAARTTRPVLTKATMNRAPTFEHYVLLHEGRLRSHICGAPPTVSTHPGVHCRKDGSCYRMEHGGKAVGGHCRRAASGRDIVFPDQRIGRGSAPRGGVSGSVLGSGATAVPARLATRRERAIEMASNLGGNAGGLPRAARTEEARDGLGRPARVGVLNLGACRLPFTRLPSMVVDSNGKERRAPRAGLRRRSDPITSLSSSLNEVKSCLTSA